MADPTTPRVRFRTVKSALDQQVANEEEAAATVRQNSERFKEKLRARASRKTLKAPRRDELADRDIHKEIQRALNAGDTVRLSVRTAPPVIKRRIPIYSPQWKQIEKGY